jgi:hypothetical protein
MIFFFGLALVACVACTEVRVDPDTLPSIEILLVPPKQPLPQIRAQLIRIHNSRERMEARLQRQMLKSYQSQQDKILKVIQKEAARIMKDINRKLTEFHDRSFQSSFIDMTKSNTSAPDDVENLVVQVKRTSEPDAGIRSVIKATTSMQRSIESKQLRQASKEIKVVGSAIVTSIKKALSKHFKRFRSTWGSFLQTSSSGINQILNVRVGSSNLGDGLGDGASYPSVVGMVEDEYTKADMAEDNLLRLVLKLSNNLVEMAIRQLNVALSPESQGIRMHQARYSLIQMKGLPGLGHVASKLPIPPGAIATIRKRALEHSTVEVDITPPDLGRSLMISQLNADLQGFKVLHKSRVATNLLRKRALVKSIKGRIDNVVKRLSRKWDRILTEPSSYGTLEH